MIITVEQLLNWDACHHESTLRRWVGDGVTPLQVADCRHLSREITVGDRLWVLLRPEIIPERELRLLACRWARRTLRRERRWGREPDTRSWGVVATAERFARGEATREELNAARAATREELNAARAAARAADLAAARVALAAARDAALEAALEAAREADLAAARVALAAARDAASASGVAARIAASASGYAALAAERRRQLADVRARIHRPRFSPLVPCPGAIEGQQ